MYNRKIVLDTETTGINKSGIYYTNHRIIEIAAIELINRKITNNIFHKYINPNRLIDKDAFKIHKIKDNFLHNKPTFKEISNKFINFIYGSELIIHNAKFDIDFINYELELSNNKIKDISKICKIVDSLNLARNIFPGKKNSLDALCERFFIKKNKIHGALIDSKALAKIFLLMTGGQISINFDLNLYNNKNNIEINNKFNKKKISNFKILYANDNDINKHKKFLQYIEKKYRLN